VVLDALGLAQQRRRAPAPVGREVRPHPGAQVGGPADVEHLAAAAPEQVDAGGAGQALGQAQLGRLRVAAHRRERQQVVERGHAEAARPFEQAVEEVAGGQGVAEGPVRRRVGQAEVRGQGAQPVVGDLVVQQPAGQHAGVDRRAVQGRVAGPVERGGQEGQVEPHVVADHDAAAEELQQGRQDRLDRRSLPHHRPGDAGQERDRGRDVPARIDHGLQRSQALAAAQLDHAHLGDAAVGRGRAGGLEVEHAERDLVERCAKIVDRALTGRDHAERGKSN
jgi:hypothetical protein